MAAFEVVVGHERVEVALNLLDGQIEVLAALHPEGAARRRAKPPPRLGAGRWRRAGRRG